MPKVYLLQDNKYSDITDFIATIKWSGGKSEVARKLEIKLINSILDKNIPDLYIKNGSILKLFNDDGKLLYKGFVFFNSRASKASSVIVTSYDHLIYLLKNKGTYNFKNKTPEEITAILCNDFQIPKGNIAKTGAQQSFLSKNKKIYDIIMTAYTKASRKNGKKYMPIAEDGKLSIIETGQMITSFMLSDESNISDSGYSESIENMINRIKIYDSKGNYIGEVDNKDWIKAYGVLQGIYTKEKGKDAYAEAKGMLQGVEKKVNIQAVGNIECVTGKGIKLKDTGTGLTGVFFVESDVHTWSNGQHIMQLNLSFEKIMDERS